MESLMDLEKYVEDAVAHFMTKMNELQGQSVDMGNWVQLFAFCWLNPSLQLFQNVYLD